MFIRRNEPSEQPTGPVTDRVTSIIGEGTHLSGKLTGMGGVRVEGSFEGEIEFEGMLVVGTTGKVICPDLHAKSVIVAGILQGNVHAERVEIRSGGQIFGDVATVSLRTEDGAFLKGQIRMEESADGA